MAAKLNSTGGHTLTRRNALVAPLVSAASDAAAVGDAVKLLRYTNSLDGEELWVDNGLARREVGFTREIYRRLFTTGYGPDIINYDLAMLADNSLSFSATDTSGVETVAVNLYIFSGGLVGLLIVEKYKEGEEYSLTIYGGRTDKLAETIESIGKELAGEWGDPATAGELLEGFHMLARGARQYYDMYIESQTAAAR